MSFALYSLARGQFVLLPLNPLLSFGAGRALPPGVLDDLDDPAWAWRRHPFVELAPAIAACDPLRSAPDVCLGFAGHDEETGQLQILGPEDAVLSELSELALPSGSTADVGDRAQEPELLARLADPAAAPQAEREYALFVARAWRSDPAERDRLLIQASAEVFVREYLERGRAAAPHDQVLERGSELRRQTYRRVVDGLRELGQLQRHLTPATRLAHRELGPDDEATERLQEHLTGIVCDEAQERWLRAETLQLLLRSWPSCPVAWRESGRLAREPIPGWDRWAGARFQQPFAQLTAVCQDPEALASLLADTSTPAACQLEHDPGPGDRWAVETAAQLAATLAELEPSLAPRFERLVRARFLSRPPKPRFLPRRLLDGHRQLVGALDMVEGLEASLVVLERLLETDEYDWDTSGGAGYLLPWAETWSQGPALATLLLRRVRDLDRPPLERVAARQALADLAQIRELRSTEVIAPFQAAANACLVAALRSPASSEALRAVLRQHLDRFLSPTEVEALRAEGLLEPQAVPPYGEVPGAALGNGNQIKAGLDELARKVELEEVCSVLEGLPARQDDRELGRGITALALVGRLLSRSPEIAPRLEALVRPLLGSPHLAHHDQPPRGRSWPVGGMAMNAYLELLPSELKARDDKEGFAREALTGALALRQRPATYFGHHGPFNGQALAKKLRGLSKDQQASLAGWLTARARDRQDTAYMRLHARMAIVGLGSSQLLEAADRVLLTLLEQPDEDPELKAELHALLAPRLPLEISALQDEDLLPALELPPVEALHVVDGGAAFPHAERIEATAARQQPRALLGALDRQTLELPQLCTALLCVPSAGQRGADPDQLQGALHDCFTDRRQHQALGLSWTVCQLATRALGEWLTKRVPDRVARLEQALRAALSAEAPHTLRLYGVAADPEEATRVRAAHGPFVARSCATLLCKAQAARAFDFLSDVVADAGRPGPQRLAALDAFSQLVLNLSPAKRAERAAERAELLTALEQAGLVAGGEALSGLHVPWDWTPRGLPGLVWAGE